MACSHHFHGWLVERRPTAKGAEDGGNVVEVGAGPVEILVIALTYPLVCHIHILLRRIHYHSIYADFKLVAKAGIPRELDSNPNSTSTISTPNIIYEEQIVFDNLFLEIVRDHNSCAQSLDLLVVVLRGHGSESDAELVVLFLFVCLFVLEFEVKHGVNCPVCACLVVACGWYGDVEKEGRALSCLVRFGLGRL